jgi:glucokinase
MSAQYDICLDIGGTKVLGVVFDEDERQVCRIKKKTKSKGDDMGNVEQVIVSVVDELLAQAGIAQDEIHAIAAGAPGVINSESGIVMFSPNLPWRNYDIRTPIAQRYGAPFYIGNDVNVGVLGEHAYGVAQGARNVVGFFVGTGMGGGLILNGELFCGTDYKGAEFGHMVLVDEGPLCNCGQRGCLEALSSKRGMSAYVLEQAARGRETEMAGKIENGVFKSKVLKKALAHGDEVAIEAVNRACHYLAIATGNMINAISPDIVLYGGGVIEAVGDVFLEKIRAEVERYCMPSIFESVRIEQAALGDDSVLYGALSLIKGDGAAGLK